MILINEDDLRPGAYFTIPFKPEKAKRMLAQKYGKNPDDFEYDQANNRYVYKPKRKYGTTTKPSTKPANPTTSPSPTQPTATTTNTQPPSTDDEDNENGETMMKPTVEWMQKNYDKLNRELFGGELGPCSFAVVTRGHHNLGRFRIRREIYVNQWNRRIFVQVGDYWRGYETKYVDKDNFVGICDPEISMNGSYSATEDALLNTLVHEMCHYYTYMYGYCPKQAHGTEFRQIASEVCSKSNGRFVITRLANAEAMSKHKLDDRVFQRRLVDNVYSIFTEMKDGAVRLTRAKNKNLIDYIINFHRNAQNAVRTYVYLDGDMSEYFAKNGKKHIMRTYRFWPMNGDFDTVLSQWPDAQPIKKVNYDDMNNENYSRDVVDIITERVMTEIKNNRIPTDAIAITPDMNLSDVSPLEMV